MGSNSIRFVALQIADNGAYSFMYQEKEPIRLGRGLSQIKCLLFHYLLVNLHRQQQ